MIEEWFSIPDPILKPRGSLKPYQVVAVSNMGRWKKRDGRIEDIALRRGRVLIDGKRVRAYIVIAEHFLITVKRPDQTCIDHITHNPEGMNVNDVRNLRWCNHKENANFEECKERQRIAHTGSKNWAYGKGDRCWMFGRTGDKCPHWKGNNAGPSAMYKRAKKLYESGEMTEEEFQKFRDKAQEYRRSLKKVGII